MRWFERLQEHASHLLASGVPILLAGDYNVMRPNSMYTHRSAGSTLFRLELRKAFSPADGAGLDRRTARTHPNERIYTFWKYFRNAFAHDAGLRIDHLLRSPPIAGRLLAAGVDRAARGREHATDHAPAWIEIAEIESKTPRRRGRVALPAG